MKLFNRLYAELDQPIGRYRHFDLVAASMYVGAVISMLVAFGVST